MQQIAAIEVNLKCVITLSIGQKLVLEEDGLLPYFFNFRRNAIALTSSDPTVAKVAGTGIGP